MKGVYRVIARFFGATHLRRLSAAAVVLLTGLMVMSQPALAQPNSQAGSLVRASSMGVAYEMTEMCVGDQQEFAVTVNSGARVARNGRTVVVNRSLSGIRVDARIMNASLGAFQPASATTGIQPGSRMSPSSHAAFTFKAVKEGTTNVYFEVQVMDGSGKSPWLVGPIELTINNCKPMLLVRYDGAKGDATYHGTMGPVTLAMDDSGTFSESGTLHWMEPAQNPACSSVWMVPGFLTTQAAITGGMTDTTIDVTINFQSITHQECGVCDGESICLAGPHEFEEVSVSFPAGSRTTMMQRSGDFTIILEYMASSQAVSVVPQIEDDAAARDHGLTHQGEAL